MTKPQLEAKIRELQAQVDILSAIVKNMPAREVIRYVPYPQPYVSQPYRVYPHTYPDITPGPFLYNNISAISDCGFNGVIDGKVENWENGTLGADLKYARVSNLTIS